MRLLLFSALLLVGCHLQPSVRPGLKAGVYSLGGPQSPPATWEECSKIDTKVLAWSIVAAVSGALGGSSGVATAFSDGTPKYVTGSVSAGLGAFAAVAGLLSPYYAKKYAQRCTENTGGR
jgi:hypothetical protein